MATMLLTFAASIAMGVLVFLGIGGRLRAMVAVMLAYAVGLTWGYYLRGDLCHRLHDPVMAPCVSK